ncbi:MAG: hypothetical protein K2X71_04020, partial [Methylobacterium sp.]|nr:hypothetical protein [Methylobacterium sp.]
AGRAAAEVALAEAVLAGELRRPVEPARVDPAPQPADPEGTAVAASAEMSPAPALPRFVTLHETQNLPRAGLSLRAVESPAAPDDAPVPLPPGPRPAAPLAGPEAAAKARIQAGQARKPSPVRPPPRPASIPGQPGGATR